jgi:hypothetical protein
MAMLNAHCSNTSEQHCHRRAYGSHILESICSYDAGRAPGEAPTLYEVKDGKPSLVNFDFANGLYTVSKRIERGYLAIGKQRMDFWESAERP